MKSVSSSLTLFLLMPTLAGLLAACNGGASTEADAAAPPAPPAAPANPDLVTISAAQARAAGITLGGFTRQNMASEVMANGIIDVPPQNMVSISAVLGGYVQQVKVLPGQFVKKGAVVAVLRHPDYIKLQQDYLQSRARSRFLSQDLERQRILDVEDVGAKRKLQQAQADYATEQASQRSLAAQLAQLNISASRLAASGQIQPTVTLTTPLGGYVKTVGINPGQFVNPQDVLVEVVDRSDLHLQLKVFERDIARVQLGQPILFTVPARGATGPVLRARIFLVGKAFDDNARTVAVHAHLEGNDADNLLPGQYVAARIQTAGQRVRTLPEDAIIQAGEVSYAYVQTAATDSTATFRRFRLKPGTTAHGDVAVTPLQTLRDTLRVVQHGAYFLAAEQGKGQGDE
ncbi:efflux RND transporter periplasmic adaptor subunit [Hymenobacter canadensis]|uniref:Efflux RND transporter periplasmic adaptor subunit n=1 Tax=Hymenobacter canadensis TaxID=2999067 RepID=A0ABY7LRV6_9BACT|nr:efflux RND transporter periplasmic adaptor subunit [Hymenobacter canadensis]WBA43144.1 efflux RND transporter periplasmic adaptor subunit [Hymenobacter canadensis]